MRARPKQRSRAIVVAILFFFSGAAGLVYELAWTRMLVLVFGNTLLATSTVLGAYLAGLAGGAYLFGKLVDRQERDLLRWYASLELGIAVFGLIFPYLLAPISTGYQLLGRSLGAHPGWLGALRFVVCFIAILGPTSLMGGTLPVLVKELGYRREPLERRVGLLYGLNTAGSVAGCLVTGFFLLRSFGTRWSTLIAVGLNLSIAAVAWWLGGRRRPGARKAAPEPGPGSALPRLTVVMVLAGIGISGFCSLAYEVFWTRMLSLFFQNTVYSVTTMLATFLLGIALGSFALAAFSARVTRKAWLLAGLEVAIGIAGVGTPYLFATHYQTLFSGSDWALTFFKASALILLPTILIGMTLPLAAQLIEQDRGRDGETVGSAYAVNTAGSVVGALLAGFVLIPALGLQRSIMVVAGLNLFAGWLVWVTVAPKRFAAMTLVALAATWLCAHRLAPSGLFLRLYQDNHPEADVKSYHEGAVANVVVYDFWRDGYQDLYLNGVEEASSRLWHVQLFKLLGILPPLVHPHPGDGLMIAFGAGISAGAAESAVGRLSVVELNPDVEAVAAAFREENRDVLRSPRLELIVNDGRNHLWMAPRRYSVVISDATHPMSFDSWTLYSREFYALVKSRLEPGGVFAQWIPMPLAGDATRVILRTFKSVFPHTSLWMIHGSSQGMLLGTPERLSLDYPALCDRLGPLLETAGLRDYGIGDLPKLLGFFALGEDRIEQYLGGFSRMSTDDLPYPQFYGGLDQAGVETSLELVSYLETAEPYLTRTGHDAARLHQELGRFLRIARALDLGFLKFGALEYEKARLIAEGTRWQDDENIKSALLYDRKYAQYFTRRVARYPRDHFAHHSLGAVWLHQQEYARASEEFGRALELAPDFARAALGLARSHTEAGEYDLATRDWLLLRRMNPTPRYLGEATEQLGVIRVLRKLRFRPHDPALYRELAELHARQGRPIQAIRALGQGLAETNSDPGLLGLMADLCRTLDLPEVALKAYEGALKVRPDDPGLAEQVSSIRAQIDQSGPSAASENPPPESAPDAPLRPALQQWNEQPYDGKVARSTLEKTAELLLAVIQRDEKQMQAYAELSTVYEYLGRYRDAADSLAKGLGVSPGFEAAENQKERLELLDRLERGLASGEDRGGAYQRVSELYFKLGEFELSIEYLLKGLELHPNDPRSWSNLGFCYLSTGELERAQGALRRAVSLDPSSDELRRRLGEVKSLIGDGSPPPAGH